MGKNKLKRRKTKKKNRLIQNIYIKCKRKIRLITQKCRKYRREIALFQQ